ncbi:F5/8 type C domain-containing protein [Paenibacillus catalpae]|uniref:F5/8 type C domain-containing protein n=1 Tax=Paenibacillus catalpae TaxID=1045775 RepID=A0A1I1SUW2_9BACL|nr:discoidin domain-containing protein [Paenibacillus catalpae]SFD50166.1 F5/8 type C domain-containing protein [Paenibacillus catalpae]
MKRRIVILTAFTLFMGTGNTAPVTAAASPDLPVINEVTQTPWMVRDDRGKLKSETEMTIQNPGVSFDAWAKIKVTGEDAYILSLGKLESGSNNKTVDVLELHRDGDPVTFEIYDNPACNGRPLVTETREQKKIRHWKVYVAHDMHTDIGYTDYQETLNEKTFPGYLDEAFSAIDATRDWKKRDQFKYPVEASYMLYESAWNHRDAEWMEQLKEHLREGSITYPASYVNEVYANLGTEELARIPYFSQRYLNDKLGMPSNKVLYMSDEPGFSWSAVDVMVESGAKYAMLRQNPDPMHPYPKLFYYQGQNKENKLLAYNYGHYSTDEMDFKNPDSNVIVQNVSEKLLQYPASTYPYDAAIADFTTPYDNNGITATVKENIRKLNARKDSKGREYVFPEFISSTVEDFFSYVDSTYGDQIPTYKGNIESWWNYGVSSTSYETAINKENHDKLPAAEFLATMANVAAPGTRYPYEDLLGAYNNMILFDEHTWGNASPQADDQWKWKRNTAIASDMASDRILSDSMGSLSSQIPTDGKSIAVYNTLSWNRNDIVRVNKEKLPAHFEIIDTDTGDPVKHQILEDGTVLFTAFDVPGLGYKVFSVRETNEDREYSSKLKATTDTLENEYYKVVFDKSGAIASIVDKKNGNREMVDSASKHRLNEFVYYTTRKMGPEALSEDTIEEAKMAGTAGPVMAMVTADGGTNGVDGMKRSVILYEGIPRIDIVNQVVKSDAPSLAQKDEEGFFTFPLQVPDFTLRHEMPTGDARPHVDKDINNPDNEQFYSSSTAYYTVNRWIDASDGQGYGITLSPVSNPIVEYGERRSAIGDWDYNTEKPWIYSFVFNNKWHTNFQKTQPGPVTFKYALTSHGGGDWKSGRADKFGMEASSPLSSTVIQQAQRKGELGGKKGRFINIDKDNVVLTTAKLAESNGEGIILRFNETLGENTKVKVDLSFLKPVSATATDLVENDKEPIPIKDSIISFTIKGHGWKTIRIKRGEQPHMVTGVKAVTDAHGTQITWDSVPDLNLSYYEVFRGKESSFESGKGNYIGSVSQPHFFDAQVAKGRYFYKIRAVNPGEKGAFSNAAPSAAGKIGDQLPPTRPGALQGEALFGTRVTLAWERSEDDVRVKGYKVYRNGLEIKDLGPMFSSYLDTDASSEHSYEYTVKAYDDEGNLSPSSNALKVTTPEWVVPGGNIARLAAVTASSAYNSDYGAAKVSDGVSGIHGSGEWASNAELNPWVKLEWNEAKKVQQVILYDRMNLADNANKGLLRFSDGSSLEVSSLPADGSGKVVTFPEKEITWMRFEVTGGTGSHVGLSEIEAFETADPAKTAVVTASSEYNPDYGAAKATDGIIAVQGAGEWASAGELNPWIQLTWNENITINKMTLYDRTNQQDNANAGTLLFSDGTEIEVTGIPMDGSAKEVDFPAKTVTWVRFQVKDGTGANVGLSEIIVE